MRAKRNATARRRVIVARGRDDIVVVVTNFLTFDIEEWFRVNYRNCSIPVAARDMNLERLVDKFLDLCDEYCARCTFFVLATVAETCPRLCVASTLEGTRWRLTATPTAACRP